MDIEMDFEQIMTTAEDLQLVLAVAAAGMVDYITFPGTASAGEVVKLVGEPKIRKSWEHLQELCDKAAALVDKTLTQLEARLADTGPFDEPLQAA